MVNWNFPPTIQFFCFVINKFKYLIKISDFKNRKTVLFISVLFFIALNFFIIKPIMARHKCPKVPAPPGVMGISSSTTLIPSGSTMAAARSSETSGCDRGHPSKNFYTPKKKRIALFLEDNFNKVSQEIARGKGIHLNAIVSLSGCIINEEVFGRIMKKNYVRLFHSNEIELNQEFQKSKSDQIAEKLVDLIENSPPLSSKCNSG